ncbi:MAG: AAA family ATPase [Rivularia sp. (in: Bacteria)]|nr:AAA family ATPase [Rivularia sp. MS3]
MFGTPVNILGYQIKEELYNGSRTLVCRAIREKDQKPVVIKLLKNTYPNFNELLQFRNQYTIGKSLDIPGIVRPYNIRAHQNSYALVMEDFGGVSLYEYIKGGNTASVENILSIALQVTDILHNLHQNRVIHKDIKPANILINPETKQVKLIDFSIASLLPKEIQEIKNPNSLEGTLAYLSPEQTGRMNRGIDYRSDFYALGVTFYELLTGELPFKSDDAMELVHCHIAKTPPEIKKPNLLLNKERGREIPQVLSDIVMKLMAKNAEDRYQSALGLKYDLEICFKQLQETGNIEYFEIAQRDICDRFIIPEKLYGRDNEVKELFAAFERVSKGNNELILVTGFSGIGKTAVVNEIHKPIVKRRGYFIKGKFDQFNRNIPLSAFVQALQNLIAQLFSETDAQLSNWRNKLLQALGDNAQIIIEVIPELEKIIGKQPAVVELSVTAAQNRFNLLFQKFIQVFTTKEHPLVIFLDDLQWADGASLELMQLLMVESANNCLLLIGAYRNNEVFPAHPLMLTLKEISRSSARINTINLSPLNELSLNQLVADTLNCSLEASQPLTQLIYQKTKGNPFFSSQFLKELYDSSLIKFDFDNSSWVCDISEVKALSLTDDVVEFMALQLQKLPYETQNVLELAACIGNQFDLATLAMVYQKSEAETANYLWKALQSGLILPQSQVYKFYLESETNNKLESSQNLHYKFSHDRVQQAAYSLITQEQKQTIHLQIGKLFLQNIPAAEQEERMFDIVNHFNAGIDLITHPSEQEELAKLNLAAAKKAKFSIAYTTAEKYLEIGINLLLVDSWKYQYDLSLSLSENAAEVAYLKGNFVAANNWANLILRQGKTILDKIKAYEIIILTRIAQVKLPEAVKLGLEVLKLLGIELPEFPTASDIREAMQTVTAYLQGKNISDLIDLPLMSDVEKLAGMKILSIILFPSGAYVSELFPLTILTQVNLSIKYGNSAFSTFAYAAYGLILQGFFGDGQSSYQFGKLALDLVEKLNTPEMKTKTFFMVALATKHGKEHIKMFLPLFKEAYQSGIEYGDLEYASHAAMNLFHHQYFAGEELISIEREAANIKSSLIRFKQTTILNQYTIVQQVILNLTDNYEQPDNIVGQVYNEEQILPLKIAANDRIGLHLFYLHKLILCYLFEKYPQAVQYSQQAEIYLDIIAGCLYEHIFYFYDSLILLSLNQEYQETEKVNFLEKVEENQIKLEKLAEYAPRNFQHKYNLVAAEKYRFLKHKIEAIELYDKAISGAKANEYIQEEALANELAAKFYLDWGKEKIAQIYMQEAYYCYARWGAKAKTSDLEKRYPQLLQPIVQQPQFNFNSLDTITNPSFTVSSSFTRTSSIGSSTISDVLDFTSILKAAQTISSSIELNQLITNLTKIILENSGAKKTILILPQDDTWKVEAITFIEHHKHSPSQIKTIFDSQPIDTCENIPLQIINYVKNTHETVFINNCQTDIPSLIGEYMLHNQPKSVLCLPIINQGHNLGILYLENQQISGVFTQERLQVINLLCTQAAISLENARLYKSQQETNTLLNSLLQTIPDFFFAKDLQGRHILVNSNLAEFFGKSIVEIIGKTDAELFPREIAESIMAKDRKIMTQGITDTFEEVVPTNGEDCTYLTVKTPLKDSQGITVGMIGITRNITDRIKAEAAVIEKSQELENALQELKQAQLQMVQNEKMATLGNLVAGVAHEVNNPIGFLEGSISNAEEYFQDLFAHIECYQETYPNPAEEVIENAEDIDLEYISEDLPKLLDSMKFATGRITDISNSLRTFSRADTSQKVACNIHEGIDSTILILKYRLKANDKRPTIEIIKDYGELPQVRCFLGQLNQVFMNIIANAIDVLDTVCEDKTFAEIQANPHQIAIKTEFINEKDAVLVSVKDNGSGMLESVRERIFDNLFTTKGVGKGTGLGLAIAKQIVEETHHGKLICNSVVGEGTEFVLELPINS